MIIGGNPVPPGIADGVDEMVDGAGALRPHWRGLMGALAGLGTQGLAACAQRLDAAFQEEGITAILPGAEGAAWRCDPVPLPIPASEFAVLESGLAQRAALLEILLADFHGGRTLLAQGVLPPALVFANPGFLRAQARPGAAARFMESYAADLIRGPDGAWHVLADRCAMAGGIAHACENRRILGRVMPDMARGQQIRPLRPFFDQWQDALQRAARAVAEANAQAGPFLRTNPGIALLTPGTGSAHWFEHLFLSRELSCALVEGGDITIRDGGYSLKTLRGLQPIDLLLSRVDGRMIDPLELDPDSPIGVAGLLDAARAGAVRLANDPGSGAAEAPALAAWLPDLALRLLDQRLELPSVPTLWLGTARARAMVAEAPARWLIRPAADARAPAIRLAALDPAARAVLLKSIMADGAGFAASAAFAPSLAPCLGPAGLVPRPVVLRLFLIHDGARWRAMQGGLARVPDTDQALAGSRPRGGVSKDVWVLSEERADIIGPAGLAMGPMAIRRTSGDLPSRVADNLFWLGRYVERLENAARLARATLSRLGRDQPLPREERELRILCACLADAGMVPPEMRGGAGGQAALCDALLAGLRADGVFGGLFGHVARLTELVRDRLTGDMYATVTHALRHAHADAAGARGSTDRMAHAMASVLRLGAGVAGVAAENMVRGGGWLFLDLGRRIERAQAVIGALGPALDQPARRIGAGLRLALELCDSAITYRSRYLTVLQPAPVLDLVLADEGNPRALAFQLEGIWHLLSSISAGGQDPLAAEVAGLLAETGVLVRQVIDAPDQAQAAARLPAALHSLAGRMAALSDRISRRYFALLPAAHPVGLGAGDTFQGAAA